MKKALRLARDLGFSSVILATFIYVGFAAAAGAQGAENRLVLDGSTTVGPIAKAFAEYYMRQNREVRVSVSESGSGNGAKSLVNGTCDIATMSRPMKDTEFKAAADKSIQPVAHVVALDGIAIVVHLSNSVSGLSLEQVRNIYLGTITNWREVGGPDTPISVITRETNSGTYECFEEMVMKKGRITDRAETVGSNGQARARLLNSPGAIAYLGIGFIEGTKAISVNGILPAPETVRSGAYPVARPLFMYTNGYPHMGSHLYRFVTLHLTEDGQSIIEEAGYVPTTLY